MTRQYLNTTTLVAATGRGRAALRTALEEGRGGLAPIEEGGLELYAGAVAGVDEVALPADCAVFDCRNNRLLELALQTDAFAERALEAVTRHGAHRVGVFLATSTAGMRETEEIYRSVGGDGSIPAGFTWDTTHRLSSPTAYLQARLGLTGVSQSISTACSSSAKAFASAARHIEAGLCDAAIVGGVDSLCRTTQFGFHALELTAADYCRPFSGDRDGMCLGEAAGLALLEPDDRGAEGLALLGYGESSDAHHMSTPHPQALGARLAMRRALAGAGIGPEAIDYVNLHGTATPINDAVEDMALAEELGTSVPASSTKGWTGHTLGAAGVVELIISALALEHGFMPRTLNTESLDTDMRCNILLETVQRPVRRVLSNSFGFGGSNCALVLGRAA